MRILRVMLLIAAGLFALAPREAAAATAKEINDSADKALQSFVRQTPGAKDLALKAAGILVFPSVLKAGLGFGGEYGEGVLIVHHKIAGYYNLISASFGFQLGVQSRSVIMMFMTDNALASFESTYGWKVGVDGSVAVVTLGAGGAIDTETLTSPVIAFILDPTGLMYNLNLEGSKISRIER
jgi:lipid-binding SYLF domain-containing protein